MSAANGLLIGPVAATDRGRVTEILRSTENFRGEEIDVALELFDESFVTTDYVFVGAYARESGGYPPKAGGGTRESMEPGAVPVPDSHLSDDRGPSLNPALIGFACFGPTAGTDRTFDLYWIAIDRAAHGKGWGSLLLSEVERSLEALHARMLVVETSSRSDYAATREFYLRRGYVEAARVREFYAPHDDRIILTKRLAGSPEMGWGAVA